MTLRQIDERPLTGRQKKIVSAAVLADMMEFYDFFLLGFIVSIIVVPWDLTYGQTAVLILTGGVGSIVGAFGWGAMADRVGRRPVFIATVLTFSLSTGLMALVPDGSWALLALLRFFVGFGVGGLYSVDLPLVQEYVPTRQRGLIGGIVTVFVPAGLLLGSVLSSTLGDEIGWRGLVLIGALPALFSLYIRTVVPESPRWLLQQGRTEEARRAVAWALEIPPEQVDLSETPAQPRARLRELFRYPRSLAVSWGGNFAAAASEYGIILWGPTLLALSLDLSPEKAASLFIFVALAGIVGRVAFSVLSERVGRPRAGGLMGAGGTLFLVLCAVVSLDAEVAGVPLFVITLLAAFFFTDGGFAIVGPYAAEVWPQRLRASGMGSAYGFGGVGRIAGPVGLALIAGSSEIVSPKATVDAIAPAFVFLAAFAALGGIIYRLVGFETRGRSLEELETGLGGAPPRAAGTAPAFVRSSPIKERVQ
jgi:MFS transporter, putative metabolite:H+ symporter